MTFFLAMIPSMGVAQVVRSPWLASNSSPFPTHSVKQMRMTLFRE